MSPAKPAAFATLPTRHRTPSCRVQRAPTVAASEPQAAVSACSARLGPLAHVRDRRARMLHAGHALRAGSPRRKMFLQLGHRKKEKASLRSSLSRHWLSTAFVIVIFSREKAPAGIVQSSTGLVQSACGDFAREKNTCGNSTCKAAQSLSNPRVVIFAKKMLPAGREQSSTGLVNACQVPGKGPAQSRNIKFGASWSRINGFV